MLQCKMINDVPFGAISAGLSKYIDHRSPKAMQEGLQITGVAMVNLRPQQGLQDISKLMTSNSKARWGNKFGMLLLPVYYHQSGSDALQYVKRAKAMIDWEKLSLEAQFLYKIGNFVMYFGSKVPKKAITMHVVSYAGKADMQILVAKDTIPDPQFLAKCFEDASFEMKEAAEAATEK